MLRNEGIPSFYTIFANPISKHIPMKQSDILRNLKIEQLTPMQEAAIEAYASHKDLVLLSPTGSGKTLAFLLPLVQSLRQEGGGVQAVVLGPSRELALQIETVFKAMNTPFKVMSCYGGAPCYGGASDHAWHEPIGHHRHTGTDERPFEERQFGGFCCHNIGY